MDLRKHYSFGVAKPVGHVVVALPSSADADAAQRALDGIGVAGDAIERLSDREMLELSEQDLEGASPVASLGSDIDLARSHRSLAKRGCHWLLVRVDGDKAAQRVAGVVAAEGALLARHYGHFIIEDMIAPPAP